MGLDAIVRCTCFAQGLTSPPPVPITLDEWGFPNFDLDAESSQSDHERYISWMESCCAHPLMCYARERIGCWGEYEAFREALGQAGWSWFPTLARELPGDNRGETAPSAAAEALRELALFRSLDQIGEGTFLVDTATNEAIHYRVEVDEGVMLWTPSLRVALTDRDLVIIDTDFEVEVFRARRIQQILMEPDRSGGGLRDALVEFTNLDTGETHVGSCPIPKQIVQDAPPEHNLSGPEPGWEYPRRLHVERRPVRPEEFLSILEPLERIFRASVAVGNPVEWC